MQEDGSELTPRVLEALYTEAMCLADEARGYFDMDRETALAAGVTDMVAFNCESLKITTRLMHCIAWLLSQKQAAGAPNKDSASANAGRPLGTAPESTREALAGLPPDARLLVAQSMSLHARLCRLHAKLEDERARRSGEAGSDVPPVHKLFDRLAASF